MFNTLLKKGKSNKGFTLIELIVVIAILAILALLLVPRFAGFTDKARTSADSAAMKSISTSVTALMANSELARSATGNGSFDIPDTGAWPNVTNLTGSAIGTDNLETSVEKLIGTNHDAQTSTAAGFRITIDGTSDNVSVTLY